MSGRARLPAGAPLKASQRGRWRAAPSKVSVIPVWRTGDKVRWRDRIGDFRREIGDGEKAPLVAAQVIQEETSQAPPEQTEQPEIALRREHVPIAGALLSTTERAALVTRLDQKPARADWAAHEAQLEAMLRTPR